ncbi:MAG: M23 family metallopeptidase, partial [Bryobacteraceae bacterium]
MMTNKLSVFTRAAAFTVLLSCLPQGNAQNYLFFSRSSDIGEDNAWVVTEFGEGPYVLDLSVRRFSNGSWTSCVGGADCNTNAGRLTWGKPVYAPADGVIKTCWRNFDDNPAPGQKLDTVTGANGTTKRIFTAGNHVNIETPDGKMILLAHLRKGSVASNLCPFNAEEADVSKNGESYPAASIIPVDQRPAVKRGQFLGYAGNSGNSSGPHVHMHVKPVITDTTEGSSEAMPYIEGWAHPYDANSNTTADGWYKLDSDPVTDSDGPTMIHPSPFLRRVSTADIAVDTVEPVFLTTNRAVTAAQDSLGNLQLISWDFAGPGTITRKHEISAGAATLVKVVAHDSSNVIVALRDSGNNLKLILYGVGPTGAFTRLDDDTADQIYSHDVTMTGGTDKKIVVMMRRNPDNQLKLMVWDVDFSSGTAKLKRLGSRLEAGTVSAVTVSKGSNYFGVAAAVRTATNTLKVIPYKLSSDGMTVTRGVDYEAGTVSSAIDITAIPKGVVAAMKDGGGILRLISLETNSNGDIAGIKEAATFNNSISEVKIDRVPHAAGGNVVTTIRSSDGTLQVLGWTMTDRGA